MAFVRKRNGDINAVVRGFSISFDLPRGSLLGGDCVSQEQIEEGFGYMRTCAKKVGI
jgi:hypothetical protein